MEFDPRDRDDDARDLEMPWLETDRDLQLDRDPYDVRGRDDDTRDRERVVDPRDVFVAGLELPRGPDREVVLEGDHRYELNGEDSRTLATIGAFRVVASTRANPERGCAAVAEQQSRCQSSRTTAAGERSAPTRHCLGRMINGGQALNRSRRDRLSSDVALRARRDQAVLTLLRRVWIQKESTFVTVSLSRAMD